MDAGDVEEVERRLLRLREVTNLSCVGTCMNPRSKRIMFSVVRWIYILLATVTLSALGMLSAAAGHAPLTMLEASGSWYSLLLGVVRLMDELLFQSWIWNNTIGASGGLGMVAANVTIPIGFALFYPLLRWCVSFRLGPSNYRAFTIFYAVGGGLAVLMSACYADGGFSLALVAILGGFGVLLGVGFVCLDNLLLRLANTGSHSGMDTRHGGVTPKTA